MGVRIHENRDFTPRQSGQVVRERQRVELHSAGLHEIQTVEVAMEDTGMAAEPPSLVVTWGGRQTPPISVMELGALEIEIVWSGLTWRLEVLRRGT